MWYILDILHILRVCAIYSAEWLPSAAPQVNYLVEYICVMIMQLVLEYHAHIVTNDLLRWMIMETP